MYYLRFPGLLKGLVKSQEVILPSAEGWSSPRWAGSGVLNLLLPDNSLRFEVSGSVLCW